MPGEPLHVLHLCYHSVTQMGILRSQVVVPMRLLAEDPRLKITIVSGERLGERDAAEERRLSEDLADGGIEIEFFRKHVGPAARHRRPGVLRRALAPVLLWNDVRRMRRLVERFVRDHQPCLVHARSYVPAWAALGARQRELCRLVFDPRGALPEELRDANGWGEESRRFRWWKSLEAGIARTADAVIAVSRPMATHFRAIGGPEPLVVRNCVDLDRFRLSRRTPSSDEPLRLISLVGVDVPYQATDDSLSILRVVAGLWPGGATLRIVSPDAEAIRARLSGEGVTVESLPRERIPDALADADVGLLMRDRTLGSLVACPVKLPEYLAAGLPVIATPGIGEVDALLSRCRLGATVNAGDPEACKAALAPLMDRLRDDREELRAAARRAATELFHWDKYLPRLRAAYGLEPPPPDTLLPTDDSPS